MSKLDEVSQEIKKYPNGEQIVNRITQLWDLYLESEDFSPKRVVQVIEAHEEKLLQRPWMDMVKNKPVLPKFQQALIDSTEKEWESFKKEHYIKPLGKTDRERVFLDASGLTRETGFEEWVLGKQSKQVTTEGQLLVSKVIREDNRRGKE